MGSVLGDQWSDMASSKSQEGCTVSGRLPRAVSLTVVGEGGKLTKLYAWSTSKNEGLLEHPVSSKKGLMLAKL